MMDGTPEISSSWLASMRALALRSRTGRAAAGLLVDYAGAIISIVLTFAVTPLLVTLLGSPMYGFWITAAQLIAWLNLLDGGIGINLLKTIGTWKNSDPAKVQRVISTTFWLYVGLAVATIAIGMAISPF